MIGLFAGLVPAIGHAQTNIDQGKSPAQIFASDCGVCHKGARGLAGGKNNAALTEFLRQHYTTGREQAASLAAYVLRGGGGDTGGTTAGQKPAGDRAKPSADAKTDAKADAKTDAKPPADEPKPAKPQGRQTAKPETKPEAASPPTTEVKRDDEPVATDEPGRRPAAGRREMKQGTASRGRRKEPETATAPSVAPEPAAAPEPSAVVTEPGATTPAEPASTTAAAPAEPGSGEAPVPRDNIPD